MICIQFRSPCFNPRRPRGRRRQVLETAWICFSFNPRRPRGRRRCSHRSQHLAVSIHAARAGGDGQQLDRRERTCRVSIHAARAGGDPAWAWHDSPMFEFQSTPPARAATVRRGRASRSRSAFQSTPPARAATTHRSLLSWPATCFNPRRPRGRRLRTTTELLARIVSIHAARAGGDAVGAINVPHRADVSIHAARAGGDASAVAVESFPFCFNPRRPRGRRPGGGAVLSAGARFQSTPPTRAATGVILPSQRPFYVSIHAAHAGGDAVGRGDRQATGVSIHAAHAGGDMLPPLPRYQRSCFNPRRPRGRRHNESARADFAGSCFNPRRPRGRRRVEASSDCGVSIHAARAGGDACTVEATVRHRFQSTPPTRAATLRACRTPHYRQSFQSTPPTRAATLPSMFHRKSRKVSIHAAHAGGDVSPAAMTTMSYVFQSTPPTRAATRSRPPGSALRSSFNPRRPRGRRRYTDRPI